MANSFFLSEYLVFVIWKRSTKYFGQFLFFCLVSCVYKAPNCSTNAFFDYLGDVLGSESRQGKEFIITGDINCNLLDESLPQT